MLGNLLQPRRIKPLITLSVLCAAACLIARLFFVPWRRELTLAASAIATGLTLILLHSDAAPFFVGPLTLVLILPIALALLADHRNSRPDPTRCQRCGYTLTPTDPDACPECGHDTPPWQHAAWRDASQPVDS